MSIFTRRDTKSDKDLSRISSFKEQGSKSGTRSKREAGGAQIFRGFQNTRGKHAGYAEGQESIFSTADLEVVRTTKQWPNTRSTHFHSDALDQDARRRIALSFAATVRNRLPALRLSPSPSSAVFAEILSHYFLLLTDSKSSDRQVIKVLREESSQIALRLALDLEPHSKGTEPATVESPTNERLADSEQKRTGEQRPTLESKREAFKESVRQIRELIRERHRLDLLIWRYRDVLHSDRHLVMQDAVKADEILQRIYSILDSWDADVLEPDELAVAQKIGTSLPQSDQYTSWQESPPWTREEDIRAVQSYNEPAERIVEPKVKHSSKQNKIPAGDHEAGVKTVPWEEQAVTTLANGPEFETLLSWVNVACSTISTGDCHHEVRRRLLEATHHSGVVCLELEWDALVFVRREYNFNACFSFGEVLCLVGSGSNNQVTSCANYVTAVWPRLGKHVLDALDSAFASTMELGPSEYIVSPLPGCRMVVAFRSLACGIQVNADRMSLVEIGEIVCWLSTACCSSLFASGITHVHPCIQSDGWNSLIRITHTTEAERSLSTTSETHACWHKIFRNPVVCEGYPIDLRSNQEEGLQAPLDVIATLACANTATMYNGSILLKGLCSALIPVLRVGTSIMWHYVVNDDLSWMSHQVIDAQKNVLSGVTFDQLNNLKHFVGWSRSIKEKIGSPELPYNSIRAANMTNVGPGCAWDGITIGFSKIIEVNTKFRVGHRDSRLYFERGGTYPRTIDVAKGMNVMFHDVCERKAWLTDGASALLLLARTALSSTVARGAGSKSQATQTQFEEAVARLPSNRTAGDILLSSDVRHIPLYGDQDHLEDLWYFQSLVLEQWNLLDEMRSRQVLISASHGNGIPMYLPTSLKSEGFQFVDMISCTGPLRPKYTELPLSATWLEISSKLNAVTIFGNCFGELLQTDERECEARLTVPSGCDVLVTPIRLLDPTRLGRPQTIRSDCVELVDGVFWDEPHKSFSATPCPCTDAVHKGDCGDVVTVLKQSRPKKLKGQQATSAYDVFEKYSDGAIIIGSEASVEKARNQRHESTADLSAQLSRDSGYNSATSPQVSSSSVSPTRQAPGPLRSLIASSGSHLRRALGIGSRKADP